MKKKNLSLAFMLLSLAGCGNNGTSGASTAYTGSSATLASSAETSTALPADSSQFLMDAYRDGLNEIQLSQLALQKAANNEVKTFAHRMIDDHTRMNNEITQLAQSKNIALPTDLSSEQKAQIDKLSALSGPAFDIVYMSGNVGVHEKDVTAAREQAQQGTDADISLLAEFSLPILETHLALAEEIDALVDPLAFLANAYRDGLAEIALSKLALQKAASDEVKRFAQQMIDDHTQANNRIATLAQQKNVTLPNGLTATQQAIVDELAKFSGTDFDKTYMDQNVIVHVKDVRQTKQQSEQGRDEEIKTFAQQTLPILETHQAMAIDIDQHIEPSFLYSAYQNRKAAMQWAHLALLLGTDTQTNTFARQLIGEYLAENTEITHLAKQRNLTLPTTMSAEQSRLFVELMGKSGAAFDLAFMDISVQNNRKEVTVTTLQAQNSVDSGTNAFAQNALPALTAQLTAATQILQHLNGGTVGSNGM